MGAGRAPQRNGASGLKHSTAFYASVMIRVAAPRGSISRTPDLPGSPTA